MHHSTLQNNVEVQVGLTGYSVVMPNALNMRNTRINANPIILFLLPVIEFFIKQKAINLE